MNDEIAVKVENVKKEFKLPHEKNTSVKSVLVNFYKKRTYERQKVLKGISFEVKKGEFFGIVGRNGSGKSTLLKLLAGIYMPNAGKIEINGVLTPFIELGVGFNMELTGRENVFLNGALLGFSRRQMVAMYDDIVDFAELEKFMDQKLKNYSSGMQVRLAFSIAIRARSDILLIDEVLAVGDAAFQQKCFEVFAELKKNGTTIILVTHDMSSVLRFCDRAVLISDGKIVKDGKPAEVADLYLELNYEAGEEQRNKDKEKDKIDKTKTFIESVIVTNSQGDPQQAFSPKDKMRITAKFKNPNAIPTHFGLQVFNEAGVYCFGTNSKIMKMDPTVEAKGKVTIDLTAQLVPGTYYLTAASMNDTATKVYNYKGRVADFRIIKDTELEGVVLLDHSWEIE